jgi:hypothetical protein
MKILYIDPCPSIEFACELSNCLQIPVINAAQILTKFTTSSHEEIIRNSTTNVCNMSELQQFGRLLSGQDPETGLEVVKYEQYKHDWCLIGLAPTLFHLNYIVGHLLLTLSVSGYQVLPDIVVYPVDDQKAKLFLSASQDVTSSGVYQALRVTFEKASCFGIHEFCCPRQLAVELKKCAQIFVI